MESIRRFVFYFYKKELVIKMIRGKNYLNERIKALRKIVSLLENKLPWGLIGGLIGIASLIVGVYYAIYYEKKAEVSFQIVNESDILDVKKPLRDLEIYFEGDDIQKNNMNLKVIRLKIINTGQVDILQNFYESNEDWGFKISNGKIIEIRQIGTNSKYLEKKINPIRVNEDFIKLEKMILEKEKYISFEILVLHNKNNPPKIIPVGKIAGIDNFVITDSISNEKETSFLNDLLYGKLHIHLIRFILYFSISIVLMLFLIGAFQYLYKLKENTTSKKRKMKLKRIGLPSSDNNESLEIIYKAYIKGDFEFLKKLNIVFRSNTELKNRIERLKIANKYRNEISKLEYTNHPDSMNRLERSLVLYEELFMLQNTREFFSYNNEIEEVLDDLIKNNKIIFDDEKIVLDKEFQYALNVIIAVIS
ncbi:hypothetical protein [Lysinibacillus xylanilyticus]|uniref:hypothetical protein n=1 Tax=Lysinibacillus xylanilyticus TaxID=582475 RepID=UPI003D06E2CE